MPTLDDRRPLAPPPLRLPTPLPEYLRNEAAGGIVLMVAAALALVWANTPWRAGYTALGATPLSLQLGRFGIGTDLRRWVDDGLMTLFFLVVGLEIKRELVAGELRTWRRAALPVVAAAGGMAVPALLYAAGNAGRPGAPGWGCRWPPTSPSPSACWPCSAPGCRRPSRCSSSPWPWSTIWARSGWWPCSTAATSTSGPWPSPPGCWPWWRSWSGPGSGGCPCTSGWGGALADPVALGRQPSAGRRAGRRPAPAPPARDAARGQGDGAAGRAAGPRPPPVERLVVLPLFALANAGVTPEPGGLAAPGAEAVLGGVLAGRVLGKLAGISAAAWLAVRLGLAGRPAGTSWAQLGGAATVAGIGFTVPLFVAELAFPDGRFQAPVRLGLVAASVIAGTTGALVLWLAARGRPAGG